MAKERLDILLVERGLAGSRERAKRMIMAGEVLVDGQKIDKAGTTVKPEAEIRLLGHDIPYVSRGGLKLEKAMKEFGVRLQDKVAADVGYGQLAWKLRTDERVINMERTNIRTVTPEMLGEPLDFASIDVAFISLTKVLPVAYTLLKETGEVVALIKPQFEAGREKVGKKGVVRDPAVHAEVIRTVTDFARSLGFCPLALTYSPVKGPEGNIEYLIYLSRAEGEDTVTEERLQQVVADAHADLDR